MIKSYCLKTRILFDGEEVQCRIRGMLLTEETNIAPKTLTYTNLKEAIEALSGKDGIFYWTWKKLFRKEFYGLEVENKPFMWSSLDKKPHTLTVEYEYVPNEVSLNDILDYYDSDLAIQYLKERGLTICPIGK